MPGQAAGNDDPPDHGFGRAGQLLVIYLEEAIRRQHAPPIVDEPLVAAEVRDQFGTSGRKCQARMEMSLMDRQRRVDCSRRQWMMIARGNARWISPAQRKLNGILSVTRAAVGAIA